MSATKSYEEIIDFIAAGRAPEAVVAFRPSESVQQRVAEFVERSKDGNISAEDYRCEYCLLHEDDSYSPSRSTSFRSWLFWLGQRRRGA